MAPPSNGPTARECGLRRENSTAWTDRALHREDGPAIEYEDGSKDWFLLGIEVDEEVVMDAGLREAFVLKHRNPE